MIAAFVPCLLAPLRRSEHLNRHPGGGGDGLIFEWPLRPDPKRLRRPPGRRIYRFSVNFLRFPWFFERGALLKIVTFLLRGFARRDGFTPDLYAIDTYSNDI
jgi:hypothetical protein